MSAIRNGPEGKRGRQEVVTRSSEADCILSGVNSGEIQALVPLRQSVEVVLQLGQLLLGK